MSKGMLMLHSLGLRAGPLRRVAALAVFAAAALAIFFIDKDAPPVGADHKLGTPTDLTVTAASPTSVDVSWRRNGEPNEQNYEVVFTHQGTRASNTQSYQPGSGSQFTRTISGLESGAIYHFHIRSVALSGHTASDPSDQVAVALPTAPVSLVTNTGEDWYGGAGRLAQLSSSRTSAQGFRTGKASRGYRLSSVEVYINANVGESARDNLKAEVWSNGNPYRPGSKVHDLTVPAHPINAGTVSFTAPDRPTLTPDTRYWVVIYSTTINNGLRVTASADQDSGYGWLIGDGLRETTNVPPTTSSAWQGHREGNRVWLMSIKGTVVESNANLAGLSGRTSTDGSTFDGKLALTPATFTADRTSYTAEVGNDITHVKLTPVAADTDATVTVEGTAVDSGTASEAIALNEDGLAITVRVTAEGGSTTKDYTVTVTREAHSSPSLTGLGITGRVTRGGETHTFSLISNPWFDPDTEGYTVRVPSDLNGISFTPTWTGSRVTSVSLVERASDACSLTGHTGIEATSVSGNRLGSSNLEYPAIHVHTRTAGTDRFYLYCFNLQESSLSFDGATVEDKTYTADGEISFLGLSEAEKDALRLPVATGGFHNVTYTATGLPEGLTMGQDRTIRGTPEAATQTAATVTYTATDDIDGSASLTFQVTVNPPVAFDAEDLNTYYGRVITYTAGQAAPLTVTLPEATGGTGTLTYELVFNTAETVGPSVPGAGVHLDSSTRVLTIDGNSNDNRIALRDTGYAITYRARDENGATASASSSISVIGPPTLSNIDDQSYTVGTAVSLTLGAASGPWWKMVAPLSYDLTPQVDGLVFSGGSNPTLSGTPTVAGATAMTYTATDGNGVSASRTFTVTVVNGPNAPTAAPASLAASQVTGVDAAAAWDAVTGATGYVVQVIASDGSYPDKAVNSAPDGVDLSFIPGGVGINGIDPGNYKVRVAARNDDGVGPWSTEVSFTVKVGGV